MQVMMIWQSVILYRPLAYPLPQQSMKVKLPINPYIPICIVKKSFRKNKRIIIVLFSYLDGQENGVSTKNENGKFK